MRDRLQEENIQKLYELLDTALQEDWEDEAIDELYQKILELSFDRLADKLTGGERFDLRDPMDLYSARGVYEHALERWESGDFKGAKELFLVLSFLMPVRYKESMLLGAGMCAKEISLERFLEEFVDQERIDEESFFLEYLTPKAKEFLAKNQELIQRELQELEKLR